MMNGKNVANRRCHLLPEEIVSPVVRLVQACPTKMLSDFAIRDVYTWIYFYWVYFVCLSVLLNHESCQFDSYLVVVCWYTVCLRCSLVFTISSFLNSFTPAWPSQHVHPVEALRKEALQAAPALAMAGSQLVPQEAWALLVYEVESWRSGKKRAKGMKGPEWTHVRTYHWDSVSWVMIKIVLKNVVQWTKWTQWSQTLNICQDW